MYHKVCNHFLVLLFKSVFLSAICKTKVVPLNAYIGYSITEGAYTDQEPTCVKCMLGTLTCYIHSCDAHTLALPNVTSISLPVEPIVNQ